MDTPPTDVLIEVRRQRGAHLCTEDGTQLTKFTLSQFINRKVPRRLNTITILFQIYLRSEGGRGEIELAARSNPSVSVVLRLISAPVHLQLQTNTGLKISHRSSRLISTTNLSFVSNFAELPIQYSVVDSPEFGLVECLREQSSGDVEEFQLCSGFTQTDLEKFKVRYRHTSGRVPADSFSFNVKCGDQRSPIHHFTIDFIPVSVRVYIERSLLLNNTEQSIIERR